MSNKIKIILFILLVSIIILLVKFFNRITPDNTNYIEGIIINCYYPPKSHNTIIETAFEIKGKSYKSNGYISAGIFSDNYLNKLLVGKKAIVVFDKSNPSKNVTIFASKNFTYYNVPLKNGYKWLDTLFGNYESNYDWP